MEPGFSQLTFLLMTHMHIMLLLFMFCDYDLSTSQDVNGSCSATRTLLTATVTLHAFFPQCQVRVRSAFDAEQFSHMCMFTRPVQQRTQVSCNELDNKFPISSSSHLQLCSFDMI